MIRIKHYKLRATADAPRHTDHTEQPRPKRRNFPGGHHPDGTTTEAQLWKHVSPIHLNSWMHPEAGTALVLSPPCDGHHGFQQHAGAILLLPLVLHRRRQRQYHKCGILSSHLRSTSANNRHAHGHIHPQAPSSNGGLSPTHGCKQHIIGTKTIKSQARAEQAAFAEA